jgi:hypothetical protein
VDRKERGRAVEGKETFIKEHGNREVIIAGEARAYIYTLI